MSDPVALEGRLGSRTLGEVPSSPTISRGTLEAALVASSVPHVVGRGTQLKH